MKNNKFRELLQSTLIKTGAVVMASAIVLTSSYWSEIFRNDEVFISEAELPIFVDPGEESVQILDEDVPFPAAPKIVDKQTKTNKTTRKIKLKEKATKTYTKKSKAQKQTSTEKKVSGTETTTIITETTTSVASKFTKGSDINKQTTTVKTVITTMVQEAAVVVDTATSNAGSAAAPVQTAQNVTATQTASAQTPAASGQIEISAAAPRVDSRVSSAYTKLGFTISIDPSVNYSGVCDARSRSIVLKKSGDTVYHELGHFLAFIAGNVDKASAFQQVFEQEKDKYTMYNKAYVCQNSSEYFAESFKNYTLDPNSLRATRPLTYAAIESALNSVTDAQVTRVQTVYRSVWGA